MKNAKVNKLAYENFAGSRAREFTVCRPTGSTAPKTFSFGDNTWYLLDLLKAYERDHEATIIFSNVPVWLREDAKKYIAHLWLNTQVRANALQQIMASIRYLGRLLSSFKGRPIDLHMEHARQFVRRLCELGLSPGSLKGMRWRINKFIAFVRLQHPEETGNDFKLIFPRSLTYCPQSEPLEVSEKSRIPAERLALIIDACAADVKAYLDAKVTYINSSEHKKAYQRWYYQERRRRSSEGLPSRFGRTPRFKELHGRAIKAQAVILAVCTGRRIAAICDTRYEVRTEVWEGANDAGQKESGVMVRFRELKIRNVDEDVPCPGAFGELALKAIATAKDLTSQLRELVPECRDYLFIIPGTRGKAAMVLCKRSLSEYLNGQHGNSEGILSRYNIPGGKIKVHDFRKTRASNAWRGGLAVHEVARDLGHVNSDMTARFYISGGEECKRRFQSQMERGALSGVLMSLVGGREIVETRLERRHVEIMKRRGLIISATRYGYCALPASSGPCPRTNPCYVGPGAAGGGCDYHLLSPDALPALYEDEEVIRHNISTYSPDPQYKTWVVNQKNQLGLVEDKIGEALTLRHRFNGQCSSEGECRCGDGQRSKGGRDE